MSADSSWAVLIFSRLSSAAVLLRALFSRQSTSMHVVVEVAEDDDRFSFS